MTALCGGGGVLLFKTTSEDPTLVHGEHAPLQDVPGLVGITCTNLCHSIADKAAAAIYSFWLKIWWHMKLRFDCTDLQRPAASIFRRGLRPREEVCRCHTAAPRRSHAGRAAEPHVDACVDVSDRFTGRQNDRVLQYMRAQRGRKKSTYFNRWNLLLSSDVQKLQVPAWACRRSASVGVGMLTIIFQCVLSGLFCGFCDSQRLLEAEELPALPSCSHKDWSKDLCNQRHKVQKCNWLWVWSKAVRRLYLLYSKFTV